MVLVTGGTGSSSSQDEKMVIDVNAINATIKDWN
jgi:hypothetical protein